MSNGQGTHEWRLEQLEAWREQMERTIWRGVIGIIANLVGIILLLGLEVIRAMAGK